MPAIPPPTLVDAEGNRYPHRTGGRCVSAAARPSLVRDGTVQGQLEMAGPAPCGLWCDRIRCGQRISTPMKVALSPLAWEVGPTRLSPTASGEHETAEQILSAC